MDIEQRSKINQLLLSATPKGLLFSAWLKKNGYSDQLIKRYRESGWLAMLSKGVMYRTGDTLSAYAALSCYNRQLGKTFRQGNKNVFYRYVSRAASYDDCERRGGLAGFHSRAGVLGVPVTCAATILLHGLVLYHGATDNAASRYGTAATRNDQKP